jgi:hypothetical protein
MDVIYDLVLEQNCFIAIILVGKRSIGDYRKRVRYFGRNVGEYHTLQRSDTFYFFHSTVCYQTPVSAGS